jgi:preprotein translocase SecE subunit
VGVVQKIGETRTFVEESWDELQKVTWPDYDQLKSATIVVIVFCIMVSATIWLMDLVVRNIMELIMGIFGA